MCQRFSVYFILFILIFIFLNIDLNFACYQKHPNEFLKVEDDKYFNDVEIHNDEFLHERKNGEIPSPGLSHRVRRQIPDDHSNQYFINIIIFADTSMVNYYGNKLENYIQLIMAKVSRMFKHYSIGNSIAFGSVKIEKTYEDFLNNNEYEWNSTLFKNFCKWQSKQRTNPNMRNLNNSHVSILLTRNSVCQTRTGNEINMCSKIGIASLGAICYPSSSCAVVNDGIHWTAQIMTHEIGHLLGIDHDDEKNVCLKDDKNPTSHIMNFQVTDEHPLMWSNCSNVYLTQFLESGRGDCLLDKRREKFDDTRYGHIGEYFSLDQICEFVWGPGFHSSQIYNNNKKCGKFMCSHENREKLYTENRWTQVPDGTKCGDNKICYEGECISSNKMKPINGGWSDYGDFGECSRTCGGGVKMRYRNCNNPTPMYGGQYCLGKKKDYEICATNKCPEKSQNFRDSQCAEFNNKNLSYLGYQYTSTNWKSHENPDSPCILYCEDNNINYQLDNKVIDGTPCGLDNYHMCVNGACKKYSCDYKFNSPAKLDICGVCNGNNSTCHKVTENLSSTSITNYKSFPRYQYIYTIPAGAYLIDVKQITNNPPYRRESYIALKFAKNGSYILNDISRVRLQSGNYPFSETNNEEFGYTLIDNTITQLYIAKPISDDIIVEVLFEKKFLPTQTSLEYYILNGSEDLYNWRIGAWSRCNAICQGTKKRDVQCQRTKDNVKVPDNLCKIKRPDDSLQCNSDCILRWDVESKTECSTKCGHGTRSINYNCVRYSRTKTSTHNLEPLEPEYCSHIEKPIESEECYTRCYATWKYSNWSDCNVTCGRGGIKTRTAKCIDNNSKRIVNENMCSSTQKILTESCGLEDCPKWVTGPWSTCSVTCGGGQKTRQVTCKSKDTIIDNSNCNGSMPPKQKICKQRACGDLNHREKIDLYKKSLKLKQRMNQVINNLRDQHSNLRRIFEKDERLSLDEKKQNIKSSFSQFETLLKNPQNYGNIYERCVRKIYTSIRENRVNADNNLDTCFITRSKTLASNINKINSAISRGNREFHRTQGLEHICSKNSVDYSKNDCNYKMRSFVKLIEELEADKKSFEDYIMNSSIARDSCYDEPITSFGRTVRNAYTSYISC